MTKLKFAFALIILGLIVGTIYAAGEGNITAIVVLSSGITVVLVALGAFIALAGVRLMARRDDDNFNRNTQENLKIMTLMAGAQNQQNKLLQQQIHAAQLQQRAQLPPPAAIDFTPNDTTWLPGLTEFSEGEYIEGGE